MKATPAARSHCWKSSRPPSRTNASLPPSTIPSYEPLGDYPLAAGRKAEAAAAYQKALELRPNRSLAKRGLEAARK